ncbi:ATP-dependent DNA helicase RecQ [Brevibacillus sp. MCWH]|uniref:RecQ family ATP-dependent DNA helicase n=1 Tax=Brevibacillus sp. MCWH TaxID=2508871 RepID=UPI003530272E
MINGDLLTQALRRHFGYETFRPGQQEIISRLLQGKNVLGLLATGGGKSLTYQLPALLLPGVVVVVSPLISLMVDQVQQLRARRKIPAAYLNSTLDPADSRQIMRDIRSGACKLLYVSPEKLQQPIVQETLRSAGVSMVAVDEAHCISQWGHDFRTDYLRLPDVIEKLGGPPVLAVTATATTAVREEICRLLKIEPEDVVALPLNRANIAIDVIAAASEAERREQVMAAMDRLRGPGIVYCSTRQAVETLVAAYQLDGKKRVHAYHGGMNSMERMLVQTQFLRGELEVIVATNAFGMGIDKADIRYVIHYHFPASLEAYAQEIGRIGRDGAPGYAALYYVADDLHIHAHMLENEYPTAEEVARFLRLLNREGSLPAEVLTAAEIDADMARLLFFYAEQSGLLREVAVTREQYHYTLSDVPSDGEALQNHVQRVWQATEWSRRQKRQKLSDMLRWLEGSGCLRRELNRYFGEDDQSYSLACCSRCGLELSPYLEETHLARPPQRETIWNLREALAQLLPNRKGGKGP